MDGTGSKRCVDGCVADKAGARRGEGGTVAILEACVRRDAIQPSCADRPLPRGLPRSAAHEASPARTSQAGWRPPIIGANRRTALPHFTLQYSANLAHLDVKRCLAAVNADLARSGHFHEIDIKSRAIKAEEFQVGVEAEGRGFVAGQLAVLSGRSEETRREMGRIALDALLSCLSATPRLHVQVSVEVVEMHRDIYAKAVLSNS